MSATFFGRELVREPRCPFCGNVIEPPKELPVKMPRSMPVGACPCGAVYACDVTGHNIGAAMIEALVFGCGMDWDLAWSLLPEEDYLENIVEHYDIVNHLIVPGGVYEGRRISGTLFFIRLQEDILELTEEGIRKRIQNARPIEPNTTKRKSKPPLSKKQVEEFVRSYKPQPIIKASKTHHKTMNNLQRLLYSPDDRFRMRAAEILGMAASEVAEDNPEAVSRLLQRLFTSITDTAASSWGAFEAIAEIISRRTDLFAGYIPQLFSFLADDTRQADCLKAVGTIAKSRPDILRRYTFYFIPFLQSPKASVRGYAAILLGNLGAKEAREDLKKLINDPNPIQIYDNGSLKQKTIGQVSHDIVNNME